MSVRLRIILGDDSIHKLVLPNGLPGEVGDLITVIADTFNVEGEISLLYEDQSFCNQLFSLTNTSDLCDMATVKVVIKEPTVVLDFSSIDASGGLSPLLAETSSMNTSLDVSEVLPDTSDDGASLSSQDTLILPKSYRSTTWPVPFKVPDFSKDVENILAEANKTYHITGQRFQDASVKSAIRQNLAETIFHYTAYPSNLQIVSVVEALITKFPCLKEPGSFTGMYGWQQSLKYKMHNYRTKLKSRSYTSYPELEVNMLKRKSSADATPAKGIKRPKKAEVNYLPPHPVGIDDQKLEEERIQLIQEVQKTNNANIISEKMFNTFSIRRQEVVAQSPVSELMERWPALFTATQVRLPGVDVTTCLFSGFPSALA